MPGTAGRSGGDRKTAGNDCFPPGTPAMPEHLNKECRVVWQSLIKMIPEEILRGADEYQLGILCESIVRNRQLQEIIDADPTAFAADRIKLQVQQHIARLSAMYGLSPADRKRLNFEINRGVSDIEEWMSEA